MLKNGVEERMLLSKLKDAVDEQQNRLSGIGTKLDTQKKADALRELDCYITGFFCAALAYAAAKSLHDGMLALIEEKFGELLRSRGFTKGFLTFQEVIPKLFPSKKPAQGK